MPDRMAKKIDLTTTTEVDPSTRVQVAMTTATEAVAPSSMTDASTEGTVKEGNVDEGYDLFKEAQKGEVTVSQEASHAVRRKIDLHLLPLMCLLYGLNFVDKVAMGWAALFDFREDLGIVGAQYAWAGAMFYFGYLAGQYPANYLLQRYKTARTLSCAAITWGVLMLAHLGLRNSAGLMAVRFLLGVSESVVSPGFVLYTSTFYTRQEQVLRTMLWAAMCGTFSILASLLSFGLGHIINTALKPWMYIFLVLGIISFLTGVAWLFLMPETPSTAKFLTHEEKVVVIQRVAENMMGVKGYDWKKYQVWHAIQDIKTWLLLAFVLFIQLPNGGLTNFGTLVVAGFGFSNSHTLLILLPASVVSAGSMVVWGYFSMKHENLRTWGMIIPLLLAIAGMAALLGTSGTGVNRYVRVVAFWLVNSYAVTWPFCLTMVGQNIAGHTKRAATQTMLFQVFAVGNIAGPFFFRTQDAPEYVPAITISLVCFCVALLCAAALRIYMAVENRRRDRMFGKLQTTEEKIEGMCLGMHDKTDLENMDFRYVL